MYSSNPDDFQKFSTGPPYSQSVTTGVPVSSANQFYTDNSQSQSQSQPQPQPQPPILIQRKPRVPWSTGLCDCFVDVPNCCVTCWCPCITFGRIAEIVDKGSTSCGASGALYTLITCVIGCPCCYSCFYRSKMRQQYSLHESPCGDCLVHCCCESCSLCQEYRELQNRGFEMTIGWHGNVERQNRGMAMGPVPPAMEEGMSR